MRIQLKQSGSQVQVRMSYRDSVPDVNSETATIENGVVTWTSRQTCVARFQWPGYDYDNPGQYTVTLSLHQPAETGQSGPRLLYVQEIHWNVPCSKHPIGTERIEKILRRR